MLSFSGFLFKKNLESLPADFNLPEGVAVDDQTMDRLKSNGNRQLFNPAQIQSIRNKLDTNQKDQTTILHEEEKPHYFKKSYFSHDDIYSEETLDIVQIGKQIFALNETRFSEKPGKCYFTFTQRLDEKGSYGPWFLCKTIIIPRDTIKEYYASQLQMVEREVYFLKKTGQLIGSGYYKKSRKKNR